MSALAAHYEELETDELLALYEKPEQFTSEARSAIVSVLTMRGVPLAASTPESARTGEPSEDASEPLPARMGGLFARFRRRPDPEPQPLVEEVDPGTRALLEQEGGRGFTELMKAAADGDVDRLAGLIERGVDLDERDRRGGTALAYAARYGHKTVVEFLLANGSNPNIPTAAGRTPAQLAQGNGHLEVAALLQAVTASSCGGCCGGGCGSRSV